MDEMHGCSCGGCSQGHEHKEHAHNHSHDEASCSCGNDHAHGGGLEKSVLYSLAGALLLLFAGLLLPVGEGIRLALLLGAYAVSGWKVLRQAGGNILKGRVFDEAFLMSVASLGACLIGDVAEGAAVMLFYNIGELFQSYAVGRSRGSITALMDIRPDVATVRKNDGWEAVAAETVAVGDLILVKAGERIPLDGTVVEGTSQLDTAALTGESVPRSIYPGDGAMAGCVNLSGLLQIRVEKPFGESTASKILELTEHAGANKARAEQFITKFARIYTPAVVIAALVIAVVPPLFGWGTWSSFLHRALTFLVISCPCALVISVPMGFFAGIGCASKNGILVKGGNFLEALCQGETVAFDKTGTLTQGVFQVTESHPAQGFEDTLLEWAALAEAHSTHPIAQSLRKAYGKPVDDTRLTHVTEVAGGGVKTLVDGVPVLVGNERLLAGEGIAVPNHALQGTAVYLAVGGSYAGLLVVGDRIKPEAKAALANLKALGVRKTVMLTGDHSATALAVGREVGVDEVKAQLLPGDKVEAVEVLLQQNSRQGKLLYIGDGMNDAPVLARADVGIAMGGMGTDAAMEAADVVIMDDNLDRLPTAIRIGRRTRSIVIQNIVFALGVKAIVLTLGAMGMTTMWAAVFADVGVSFLAVLNSMRALRLPDER